ncbi:MAG: hypothetical protein H6726_11015 [Sandaracinaceae bacterium]|nr:hypothetical protein [Myxococcales bacterium]MCB9658169.1 hypothetical protein [Sandaracinaceae bacterium]
MRRLGWALSVALLATLVAGDASAFEIRTGFSRGCHEQIATSAFLRQVDQLPRFPDSAVPNDEWEGVADAYLGDVGELDRATRFFLFSVVMGARAPDTEGHSITNVQTLRAAQADPGGQYLHCLRAATDDFDAGNASALAGCRAEILDSFTRVADAATRSGGDRAAEVDEIYVTLDVYGVFEVKVWEPAYRLGRALHTLSDSFAHTLRTADLRGVVHVMNFEAPLAGRHDEERDGMAHSEATDRCSHDGEGENRDRYAAAVDASSDLLLVFAPFLEVPVQGVPPARAALDEVLARWLTLTDPASLGDYGACTRSNDYCASPWLELARRSPTTPVLSCSVGLPPQRSHVPAAPLAPLVVMTLVRMVRRRARRRAPLEAA